jgi:hypothetical protein
MPNWPIKWMTIIQISSIKPIVMKFSTLIPRYIYASFPLCDAAVACEAAMATPFDAGAAVVPAAFVALTTHVMVAPESALVTV